MQGAIGKKEKQKKKGWKDRKKGHKKQDTAELEEEVKGEGGKQRQEDYELFQFKMGSPKFDAYYQA